MPIRLRRLISLKRKKESDDEWFVKEYAAYRPSTSGLMFV